jgi:hypothetical protein
MRITTTRRIVAAITLGISTAAASAVLLFAPTAAGAAHTLGATNSAAHNAHTL